MHLLLQFVQNAERLNKPKILWCMSIIIIRNMKNILPETRRESPLLKERATPRKLWG